MSFSTKLSKITNSNNSGKGDGYFDKLLIEVTDYIDTLEGLDDMSKATIISSLVPAALNAAIVIQNNLENQKLVDSKKDLDNAEKELIKKQKDLTTSQGLLYDQQKNGYRHKSYLDLFKISCDGYSFLKGVGEESDASGVTSADVSALYDTIRSMLGVRV